MLSDAEADFLNRQTAIALGWQRIDAADVDGGAYWILPDGGMKDAPPHGTDVAGTEYEGKHYGDFYVLPDFCRKPAELGHLIEWLEKRPGLTFTLKTRYWSAYWSAPLSRCSAEVFDFEASFPQRQQIGHGETPGEALCLAIIVYGKNQVKQEPHGRQMEKQNAE